MTVQYIMECQSSPLTFMETTSLGLLQDGTRDLETEGGRTSSRATAPETERASATTDSWSIARVVPVATAGCGSAGRPGAALGERADDDAYQAARCHRPGVASRTCRCPDSSSGHAVAPSSRASISPPSPPPVVNIVPAPTPSISLKYSFDGTVSSSSPVLVSTPVSTTTDPAQGPAPQKLGAAGEDPEQSELTPAGMQQLPALPWTGDVEVSGTLQPAQTWMTYKIPVGSTTLFLKVTVSQLGPQGEPTIPRSTSFTLSAPRA